MTGYSAYRINAQASRAELLIYGEIGENWLADESVTAKQIARELSELDVSEINVRINSFGGSVADGLAIFNSLARHPARIVVDIDGVAMSIASLIAMAGDTVRMAANGLLMIHAPWGAAVGNARDLRDMADVLDRFAEAMVSSYGRNELKDREEILGLLTDGQDHFFTAQEALEAGWIDEIADALPIAAAFKFLRNRYTEERFNLQPAAQAVAATYPQEGAVMPENTQATAHTVHDRETDRAQAREEAVALERKRMAEINKIASQFERREMADTAIEAGESADQFRARMLDVLAEERSAPSFQPVAEPEPVTRPGHVPESLRMAGRIEMRMRYRGLKAFADLGDEAAYRSGMWTRAEILGDQRAARWCRDYGVKAVMTGTSTGDGAALVPDEMTQAIINLREQYGVARRYCRIYPMGSDSLAVPRRTGGVTAYFPARTVATPESDKTWDAVTLNARELSTLKRFSIAYAEDAVIDVAEDLAGEMAYAFAIKEDDCLFNGDGTSTYGGIYGIRAKILGLAGAVDAASNHDTLAEIDNDDLVSVTGALPEYPGIMPAWFCSKRAKALVFDALKLAAGGNTLADIGQRPGMEYLGDEIVISQAMPKVTTDLSDVVMLVYGDLRMGVAFGDRRGFTVQVLRERYAEYRQIGIIGTERMDLVPHGVGDASNAGPIVALVGE